MPVICSRRARLILAYVVMHIYAAIRMDSYNYWHRILIGRPSMRHSKLKNSKFSSRLVSFRTLNFYERSLDWIRTMMRNFIFMTILAVSQMACATGAMPAIDYSTAVYEVPVEPGVSYEDVVTSLKVTTEGMNFVNPANFPIGEHMKLRGLTPEGP